jgi:tRNA nucleotidyltransferase/poly(A) polymerase
MKLIDLFTLIESTAKDIGSSKPYICGGVARDFYRKKLKDISDIDITTGDQSIFKLADAVYKELTKEFKPIYKKSSDGHISLFLKNIHIDFSSNFIVPNIDGIVTLPNSLQKEVYSRDFTCNSLLLDMNMRQMLDLTKRGIKDIDRKVIDTILAPEITLTTNKNRVSRIIYSAVNLDFNVAKRVVDFVKENPETFTNSTAKVSVDKMNAAFTKNPEKAAQLVSEMNLWKFIPITDAVKPYYLRQVR